MNVFKKILFLAGAFTLIPLYFPSTAQGSRADRVDSDQRLQFLNQATGNSSSSGNNNSFQNRLDSILSTNASVERTYVAAQDADARQEANLALLEDEELEKKRLQELNPQRYDPKSAMDFTKIADNKVAETAKYDASEKAYETEKANIQKEFDERIKNNRLPPAVNPSASASASAPGSGLPPSLANNPFYNQSSSPGVGEYENMKPLIANRLMTNWGYSKEQVDDYVRRASSKEELIMILMKEPGLNYSEAEESVS